METTCPQPSVSRWPDTANGADLYARRALETAPRILGLGDRQPDSPTFGCFDRTYWHYKLLDLPNARYQEAALLLALLYASDLEGNRFFARPAVRAWAEAAVAFWARIRNRDGSVNEVYPRERSFCATAFSTFAVTETVRLLGLRPPDDLDRTARWLARNNNPGVANQMAAAALALHNSFELTGDNTWRRAAQEKVDRLLEAQHPEGYFPEYGGYDIGYLSLSLSCLTLYRKKAEAPALDPALHRALHFLDARIDGTGTFDIEGTSRRTQFLYPAGFVRMGGDVLRRHRAGLESGDVLCPAWLDDRYVVQLSTDYLLASLEARP